MGKSFKIAPSILSADFANLAEDVSSVEAGGCDWIHVDVMDGHFVPNITIGPVVVKSLRERTKLPLDVHLMIEKPEQYIESFAKAGSDYLTIHYEACRDFDAIREQIRGNGVKPGISVKPGTELTEDVIKVLKKFDLVLIMTVEPGFGGQSFMHEMVAKIKKLRPVYEGLISVDGGINDETAALVREAGVDVLVAGSYIFKQSDRKAAIQSLLPS